MPESNNVASEVTKEFGVTSIAQVIALGIARIFGEVSAHSALCFTVVIVVLTIRPMILKHIKARHHAKPKHHHSPRKPKLH